MIWGKSITVGFETRFQHDELDAATHPFIHPQGETLILHVVERAVYPTYHSRHDCGSISLFASSSNLWVSRVIGGDLCRLVVFRRLPNTEGQKQVSIGSNRGRSSRQIDQKFRKCLMFGKKVGNGYGGK